MATSCKQLCDRTTLLHVMSRQGLWAPSYSLQGNIESARACAGVHCTEIIMIQSTTSQHHTTLNPEMKTPE
eukprot:4955790-Amphidinium_carterae.1